MTEERQAALDQIFQAMGEAGAAKAEELGYTFQEGDSDYLITKIQEGVLVSPPPGEEHPPEEGGEPQP